ncbi:MAG: ATP-binding protein [Bacteroidota bacterium]
MIITISSIVMITVLSISALTINSLVTNGKVTKEVSGKLLNEQIGEFLKNLIDLSADGIEQDLEQVKHEVNIIGQYATTVFNEPEHFNTSTYWNAKKNLVSGPGGQKLIKEHDKGGIFIPNYIGLTPEFVSNAERWMLIEPVMMPVFKSNPMTYNYFMISETQFFYFYPYTPLINGLAADFTPTRDLMYAPATPENNPKADVIWSPLYEDAGGLGLMISAMMPIYQQNQFIGALGLDVTLNKLTANLTSQRAIGDGFYMMIDSMGRALALPDKGYEDILGRKRTTEEFGVNVAETNTPFRDVIGEMLNAKQGFKEVNAGEESFYVIYRPIANTDWSIAYVVNAKNLNQIITNLETSLDESTTSLIFEKIIPITFLLLLAAILVGVYFIKRLINPIKKLSKAANALGKGKWDQELPSSENGEVGVLTNAFASMSAEIKKVVNNLEKNVADRTEELNSANQDLLAGNTQLLQNQKKLEKALVDLKNAQGQLIRSEKMASLGVLAAGIGHEINNPLNYIEGGASGIKRTLENDDEDFEESMESFLNLIFEGVNRASNIVQSLSHFGREGDYMYESCHINKILDHCQVMLKSNLSDQISIRTDYCEEPLVVRGNDGKLHQVFLNIIKNASQAIDGPGTIRIVTTQNESQVTIKIVDSGIGIPLELQDKIFDLFFTTKSPGQGTGLGLSISYEIVTEHKGTIDVASDDHGTVFTIVLPKE